MDSDCFLFFFDKKEKEKHPPCGYYQKGLLPIVFNMIMMLGYV